jgi:hypothetical protein
VYGVSFTSSLGAPPAGKLFILRLAPSNGQLAILFTRSDRRWEVDGHIFGPGKLQCFVEKTDNREPDDAVLLFKNPYI